jgi:hypothetical protein
VIRENGHLLYGFEEGGLYPHKTVDKKLGKILLLRRSFFFVSLKIHMSNEKVVGFEDVFERVNVLLFNGPAPKIRKQFFQRARAFARNLRT